MTNYAGVERRSGSDRRRQSRPLIKRLICSGKREYGRRAEDRRRIIAMDIYQPSQFITIMIILSLSLLDALLTLILIDRGAHELNPVMAYYLDFGPHVFLLVKYGLTVLSVLIIVLANQAICSRHRLCIGILPLFAAFFGAVVVWEIYLLSAG